MIDPIKRHGRILGCVDHDFLTSDPRRMEAHMLTSHPGYLEKVREGAGVSEKGAARQPSKIKEGPVGQVKIDPSSRQAWRGDQEVILTRSEYELLAEFAKFQTVAISRNQLLRAIGWKGDGFETRTVDAHLYRLRTKIGPIFIAVPGFGYRLSEQIEVVERNLVYADPPRAEAQSLLVCPSCNAPLKGYIDLLRAD